MWQRNRVTEMRGKRTIVIRLLTVQSLRWKIRLVSMMKWDVHWEDAITQAIERRTALKIPVLGQGGGERS